MARGVPCRWLMPLLHWCRRCGFPRLYLRPPSTFGAPTFLPSFLFRRAFFFPFYFSISSSHSRAVVEK